MTDNPLANIGNLTKPATVLIQKISNAIGGIAKPWQIVRTAKAQAKAERIRAEMEIEIIDLKRRAVHRFIEEEAMKQHNIEEITRQALPLLDEKSSPDEVEDDWITNFFDKCRLISDKDMQQIWSRILAGEANIPGTFSKRTINLVSDLDKNDAEMFTRLCDFGWVINGKIIPLISNYVVKIYQDHGVNFDSLSHLESLGLIRFNSIVLLQEDELPKVMTVSYHGKPVTLTFPKDTGNELTVGMVIFTRAGKDLAPISGSKAVDGFFDFIYDFWADHKLVPRRENGPPRPQAVLVDW
jgi:hypothetical protein